MKSTRFWIIVIAAIFAVSCAVVVIINIIPTNGTVAEIYRDGELVQSIDLTSVNKPYTITLEKDGEINIIEVERGRIRMQDATCPDETCVHQGWISTGVTPVVCLPHGIIIKITGAVADTVDAVAAIYHPKNHAEHDFSTKAF